MLPDVFLVQGYIIYINIYIGLCIYLGCILYSLQIKMNEFQTYEMIGLVPPGGRGFIQKGKFSHYLPY